jgi:CheY-like chemotaxis protein
VLLLIVEDQDDVRQALRGYFAGKPYDLIWVRTGRDALSAMHAQKFDLIILDLILDGTMTGWDLAYIKYCDPELAKVPFVIMTGVRTADVHLGAHTRAASVQAARVILQKPINFQALEHVLLSVANEPGAGVSRQLVKDSA